MLDSAGGLPCDEIYGKELLTLRSQGYRLVEVTRLAITKEHKNSRRLLVTLFAFISVFARHCWKATDFVIEVNPRHVNYYRKMLLFDVIGPERTCPRVANAPAVLLRLDLLLQAEEIASAGGTQGRGRTNRGKNLYSWFHTIEEEQPIAGFLARNFHPMTGEDAAYFGLRREEERIEEVAGR